MTHEYTQPNLLQLADYRAMSAETPMSLTEYAALCMTPDVHVAADLMVSPFEDMSYGNIAYFGAILMKTWKAALMAEFPSRRFEMRGEKDGNFDDFVITFWQLDR